jgi:hypothetical protein
VEKIYKALMNKLCFFNYLYFISYIIKISEVYKSDVKSCSMLFETLLGLLE